MADITYFAANPDQDLVSVAPRDLNVDEQLRIEEIAANVNLRVINVEGRDYESILVVTLDERFCDDIPIYNVFYIYSNGHIANAGINQPQTYPSFADLLKANYNG